MEEEGRDSDRTTKRNWKKYTAEQINVYNGLRFNKIRKKRGVWVVFIERNVSMTKTKVTNGERNGIQWIGQDILYY